MTTMNRASLVGTVRHFAAMNSIAFSLFKPPFLVQIAEKATRFQISKRSVELQVQTRAFLDGKSEAPVHEKAISHSDVTGRPLGKVLGERAPTQ